MSALNEGSQIEEVIVKLRSEGFEHIVVVDDGSTDDTFEKAKRSGAVVMKHPINCGAGAGVQTIMKLGRKEGWKYDEYLNIWYKPTHNVYRDALKFDIGQYTDQLECSAAIESEILIRETTEE